MLNKVILIGNVTKEIEIRTTQSQIPVASFCIAVERSFKDSSGKRQADFINIIAWRQQAEFANKYFSKGSRMVVVGSIQTRTYEDKNGNKRTATEVIADEIYFGEGKKHDEQEAFAPIPDDANPSLPFDL